MPGLVNMLEEQQGAQQIRYLHKANRHPLQSRNWSSVGDVHESATYGVEILVKIWEKMQEIIWTFLKPCKKSPYKQDVWVEVAAVQGMTISKQIYRKQTSELGLRRFWKDR